MGGKPGDSHGATAGAKLKHAIFLLAFIVLLDQELILQDLVPIYPLQNDRSLQIDCLHPSLYSL